MFKDPILNKLYKKHGPHKFEDRSKRLLEELVESVISQQLSGKAADTIYNRFLSLFKHGRFPSHDELLKIDVEKLRSAGMSYSKANYIRRLICFLIIWTNVVRVLLWRWGIKRI